jgi:hypothetical protein
VQEANKDNSKKEKGAKVEYKRTLGNQQPQYNTGWTSAREAHGS